MIVYLQANSDVLIHRIKLRGRPFEKSISHDYLDKVNKAYNQYFMQYRETPLLIVNTNDIDFVNKFDDFKELLNVIREMKVGVKYFLPVT